MKPGVSQSLYRAILVKIITSSRAGIVRHGGRNLRLLFTVCRHPSSPPLEAMQHLGASERRESAEAAQTGTSSSVAGVGVDIEGGGGGWSWRCWR